MLSKEIAAPALYLRGRLARVSSVFTTMQAQLRSMACQKGSSRAKRFARSRNASNTCAFLDMLTRRARGAVSPPPTGPKMNGTPNK